MITMISQEPVSSIMTANVIFVKSDASLAEAENLMRRNHIRHLPVVKNDKLIGIVSLTDLQRLSFADNFGEVESDVDTVIYNMLKLDQVMVVHPASVEKDQSIQEVAEILSEREYHALPVVDKGDLVGMVTTTDMIRYMLAQL